MKYTILAVDDALTMRNIVAFTLTKAGHEVIVAASASEALAVLKTRTVDLVLTDVNMPGMSGIELTRHARQWLGRSTPILILTTESDAAKKQEARAAGATGWLVKPFQPEQLLAVVQRVLSPALVATAA